MSWKRVFELETHDCTHRLEVEGGYIYRNIVIIAGSHHVSMTFVPFAIRESRIQNTPEELDRIESMLFQGVQTHASILRCEAKLAELEARMVTAESHCGYVFTRCGDHDWDPVLLASHPPKKRCRKCGFTVVAC